ncbi:hypothetical protein Vafri_21290 [Volvox africanus]|uniref:Uncharacterized protein n=1 Tax=Volvox africanus TaxID=51714 RepID=A0A8J4BTR3_9CHLO|nr:hypothetical protein Vafri_21290 [Volvox africanus]
MLLIKLYDTIGIAIAGAACWRQQLRSCSLRNGRGGDDGRLSPSLGGLAAGIPISARRRGRPQWLVASVVLSVIAIFLSLPTHVGALRTLSDNVVFAVHSTTTGDGQPLANNPHATPPTITTDATESVITATSMTAIGVSSIGSEGEPSTAHKAYKERAIPGTEDNPIAITGIRLASAMHIWEAKIISMKERIIKRCLHRF